jgi:hypothetical protein
MSDTMLLAEIERLLDEESEKLRAALVLGSEVLASHQGSPQREWHSAGAWLYPGDSINVVRAPLPRNRGRAMSEDKIARKNAEVEHLRAENERLRENVDRLGKEVERSDRLREEIARVKADNRSLVNRALEAKP